MISQLVSWRRNQRITSDQYTSKTQILNSGSAFDISLAVGTTKSPVAAVYNATAAASETTTLVVGDGTNTVSVGSATYNSIVDQVTAIQNGTGYNNLLFTVGVNLVMVLHLPIRQLVRLRQHQHLQDQGVHTRLLIPLWV